MCNHSLQRTPACMHNPICSVGDVAVATHQKFSSKNPTVRTARLDSTNAAYCDLGSPANPAHMASCNLPSHYLVALAKRPFLRVHLLSQLVRLHVSLCIRLFDYLDHMSVSNICRSLSLSIYRLFSLQIPLSSVSQSVTHPIHSCCPSRAKRAPFPCTDKGQTKDDRFSLYVHVCRDLIFSEQTQRARFRERPCRIP